jgi:FlaA1/EpsC-like NDP-sugar epimerase
MLDVNENEQYLLARDLERQFPDLALSVEVANIRDQRRLERLGRAHRPELIFHAAAHKHVPLMEAAPEEAVLTNVVGCLNLGRVAQAVGCRRFVLISTDKAVSPMNAMGASKALAEQIVSALGQRSPGTFTAVRFGNVLGSSGSVVPLFKAQIAAGGPVTVTEPEIRRYLMTIREAVGLVLVAGLAVPGDLCVLEMGEPIRILDLARLMITLAGHVPEEEIPIVFMGLRPGERLEERLMTDEEQRRSRRFSDMIRVIDTTAPAADLFERVARIEALALSGEREALLREMGELLPSYRPTGFQPPRVGTKAGTGDRLTGGPA